jgi:hypothetical protein
MIVPGPLGRGQIRFIQISLDLAPAGEVLDAQNWNGIEVDVYCKACEYELRLRTSDLPQRWQSYRQAFTVETSWKTVKLPFDKFELHRTETPLNIQRLRRLGGLPDILYQRN